MSDELALTPQGFSTMTPEQILLALDSGWPWPLDAVQTWFEDLYQTMLDYFWRVVGWVADAVSPIVDQVWDWIQSAVDQIGAGSGALISQVWSWLQSAENSIVSSVSTLFSQVWDWVESVKNWLWSLIHPVLDSIWTTLGTIPGIVAARITEVKAWFSGEFIDPFIDWLVPFPGKLWDALWGTLRAAGSNINLWLQLQWRKITAYLLWYWASLKRELSDPKSALWITWYAIIAVAVGAIIGAFIPAGGAIVTAMRAAAGGILRLTPAIGGWFRIIFGRLGYWLISGGLAIAAWLERLLPSVMGWLGKKWFPLFSSALVLGLGATGKLDDLIARFITPKMIELMDWAESMGPVAPGAGLDATKSVTNLITFTISGLATMTLMSEALSPFKHLGMGHISAMLYDISNYKVLTGAFVGVLAYVYVRKPLEYYYNKIARPEIPSSRDLIQMVGEGAITKQKFRETMPYHGIPDEWLPAYFELADRPFSPMLFRFLADAGELDEELLDRELQNAGFNEASRPTLKSAFRRLAAGELKTLMTSVAIKRYREGLDNQEALKDNLLALGTHPQLIPKYLFGAELDALTDYQMDLLAYYKDAYHRREINDQQFLEALDSIPLDPSRSELIYNREKIKRLKVAQTPTPVVKTLTAAQVGALYKLGKLKVDEALSRLSTYLPIPTDRSLFLMLYEPGAPAVPAG